MKNSKINLLVVFMVLGALTVSKTLANADEPMVIDSTESTQEAVATEQKEIKANKESLEKAKEAMARKDYQSAIVYLSVYIQDKSKKYEAYQLRGECFYELRQYKLAQMDFEKAIELKTDDDKFITGTKVLGAVVLGADKQSQYQNPELGKMYAQLMYSQKAQNNVAYEASYQKAFEYNSHIYLPQPVKKDIAKINCPQKYGKKINTTGVDKYITEAVELIEKGEYNEAIYKAQYITSNYPKYYLGYYLTGVSYVGLEQEKEAISAFEKSLEINPYDFESMASLGQIYYNDAEKTFNPAFSKKSIEYFEKALVYNPNCYTYYYYIGLNHLQLGEIVTAISNFNLAIKNNVSDYNSVYYKAVAQYINGDYEAVIDGTTGLLYRHVSNYNSVLYLRALAQYKKGNVEASLADIEKIQNNMNDIYNADIKTVSAKEKTLSNYLHYLKAQITEEKGFGARADLLEAKKNPIISKLSKIEVETQKYSDALNDGNVTLDDYKNYQTFYEEKVPELLGADLLISYDDVDAQYDYIRTTFDDLGVTFIYEEPNYKLATIKDYAYKKYASKLSNEDYEVLTSSKFENKVEQDIVAVSNDSKATLEQSTPIDNLIAEDALAARLAAQKTEVVESDSQDSAITLKQSTDPMDTLLNENQTSVAQMLASNMLPVSKPEAISEVTEDDTKQISDVQTSSNEVEEAVEVVTETVDAKATETLKTEIAENIETIETIVEESVESVDVADAKVAETAESVTEEVAENAEATVTQVTENVDAAEKEIEVVIEKTEDVVVEVAETVESVESVASDVVDIVETETTSTPKINEKYAKVDLEEFNVPKQTPEIDANDEVVYFEPTNYINEANKQFERDNQIAKANSTLKSSVSEMLDETQEIVEESEEIIDEAEEIIEKEPTIIANKVKSIVTSGVESLPNEVVAPAASVSVVEDKSESVAVPVVVVPALNVPVGSDNVQVTEADQLKDVDTEQVAQVESDSVQVAEAESLSNINAEEVLKESQENNVEEKEVDDLVTEVQGESQEQGDIKSSEIEFKKSEIEDKEPTLEDSVSSIIQTVFTGRVDDEKAGVDSAEKSDEKTVESEVDDVVSTTVENAEVVEQSEVVEQESEKEQEIVPVAESVEKVKKEKKSWFNFFKRKKKVIETPVENVVESAESAVEDVVEQVNQVSEDAESSADNVKDALSELTSQEVQDEISEEIDSIDNIPTISTEDKVKEKMQEIVGAPVVDEAEAKVNSIKNNINEETKNKKKFIWWWDREDDRELEDEATGGEIFGLMKNVYGEEVSKELGLQDAPQQIHTSGQRTILKEMKK